MATATGDVFYYWTTSTAGTSASTSTDDYVWSTWTATVTSSTSVDCVWHEWNSQGTTPTCSGDVVWTRWNEEPEYSVRYHKEPVRERVIIEPPKESIEERRAKAVQRKIDKIWRDLRIQEEKERKELAELTAQELLEDLIGGEELALYRETGRLVVPGRKYTYVLKKEGGVYKVEKDKIIDLCIHLKEKYKYPETDNIISLKALIEANEYEFLKIANSHGVIRDESIRSKIIDIVKRAA